MKTIGIILCAIVLAYAGSCEATPYKYYMITVTSCGWQGAEFGAGFTGFSGQNATGTNIFANYGSLASESGWIWDGVTAGNLFNFTAGARPYAFGNGHWMKFQLDQAREVGSFQIGNYISEGNRWWISGLHIQGSNDAVNYTTLYNGAVSTSQIYSVFNVAITPTVPEPTSLILMGGFLAIAFGIRKGNALRLCGCIHKSRVFGTKLGR